VLPTITVDVGTTSVKLCLFGADSALLVSARSATPTLNDEWGEIYDVGGLVSLITGFIEGLESGMRASVRRIAITGVGESGGLVGHDLSLVSPMILWHDHRGAGHLDELSADDRSLVYRLTGLPVNSNYSLSKVAWALGQAGPAAEGAKWLNIAEYLAALFSGERWAEPSLASRTMALDLTSGTWSAEVCALMGIDVDVFPELRRASWGHTITASFARRSGLDHGVQVHVAGHDHMVGAVGAHLAPGELLNSTGTTEGLLFLRDAPSLDNQMEATKLANGVACSGNEFTLFASIPSGGAIFATLQSMLGLNAERLTACLVDLHARYLRGEIDWERVPLVLPQFRGSPPPTKRANDRGAIARLRTDTTKEELTFGTFLGMVLQFRDVLELFRAPANGIKVIGPASRNALWLQLKADLLGVPLAVSRFPEVVSRGAQALASGQSSRWDHNDPFDVPVGPSRHSDLNDWCAGARDQWEYMKGLPA
jgi:sugar (pentulose or hexulose) kinase